MKGAAIMLLLVPSLLGAGGAPAGDDYEATIRQWRENREKRLKADDGWLTVAGLFWLEKGENTMGTDPSSGIVLPEGSAPPRVGTIAYDGATATFTAAAGAAVTAEGKPVTTMPLRDDTAETTDLLTIGGLRFFVIARDGRHAVRLRDLNSPLRRNFTGLSWYPIDASWRVEAAFVPHDPPKTLKVPNVIGYVEEQPSPGYAVWKHDGQEMRLEPVLSDGGSELFFIFKDGTSGKETYPAGRFLYAALPADGKVILDFNKAYSPPCAFTPHATCPLPPEGNRLTGRIAAGEMNYGQH